MIYRLLICADCGHRAAACICVQDGPSQHWIPLKTRVIEVEAMPPHEMRLFRDQVIEFLRDGGHEDAVRALTFRENGVRVIDRLTQGRSGRRGRPRGKHGRVVHGSTEVVA